MAQKNVVVTNKAEAVFVKQSRETELGTLTRRIELAIGNCNRLTKDDAYPELRKVRALLLKIEDVAHAMWLEEAQQK